MRLKRAKRRYAFLRKQHPLRARQCHVFDPWPRYLILAEFTFDRSATVRPQDRPFSRELGSLLVRCEYEHSPIRLLTRLYSSNCSDTLVF